MTIRAKMYRGVYVGSDLPHLYGRTALVMDDVYPGQAHAQFTPMGLTRSGRPVSEDPVNGPDPDLALGWHRFEKASFDLTFD